MAKPVRHCPPSPSAPPSSCPMEPRPIRYKLSLMLALAVRAAVLPATSSYLCCPTEHLILLQADRFSSALSAWTHSYNDANNQFDLASLGGSSGALHWYVTVSSSDSSGQGVELARSPDQTINLAPCPTYAKPTSKPQLPSSGNSCNLSQPACSLKGLKFDPSTCSCVP